MFSFIQANILIDILGMESKELEVSEQIENISLNETKHSIGKQYKEKIETLVITVELKRVIIWCISQFCRGDPEPEFNKIYICIYTLNAFLESDEDTLITESCIWGLSYLSDGEDNIGALLMKNLSYKPLVRKLAKNHKNEIRFPVLRIFGNLLVGSNGIKNAQIFVENKLLDTLGGLVKELLIVEVDSKNNEQNTNNIVLFNEIIWCLKNIIMVNNFYVNNEFANNEDLNNNLLFFLVTNPDFIVTIY